MQEDPEPTASASDRRAEALALADAARAAIRAECEGVPLPNRADAIKALRGCGKGEGLLEKLLADRRADRLRDF